MASPQVENGYTKIANEIIEVLMTTNLSAYQGRVLWAIWRDTYGYHKKQDWISNSQLVEMTGLRKSHVSRTLGELVARNIVTRIGNKIAFNKDYQGWRELPKRVTVTNSGNRVTDWGYRSYQSGGTPKKKVFKERVLSKSDLSLFQKFYDAYPVHKGKQPAMRAFVKINPQNGTLETILAALEAQKAQQARMKAAGQWVPEWPHPATWLNQRRWEDEAQTAETTDEKAMSPIEAYKKREGLA